MSRSTSGLNRSIDATIHVVTKYSEHEEGNSTTIVEIISSSLTIWSTKWVAKDEFQLVPVDNSDASTLFLLLNSMIGSGILVQAYVFKETGLIVTVFLYIFIVW